jgi:hypothetical protein
MRGLSRVFAKQSYGIYKWLSAIRFINACSLEGTGKQKGKLNFPRTAQGFVKAVRGKI